MTSNNFHGLPSHHIENEHLRVEFLTEGGPRVVGLFMAPSTNNLLAEVPDIKERTPYGDFYLYGGHRLWHAPEAFPRSYIPDDAGLELEHLADGVHLWQAETALPVQVTGLQKSVELHLHPDRPALTLDHKLNNKGIWPVTLAPWAITQLRLGGLAIVPQQTEPLDPAGLLPNRNLAIWPYTELNDPRLYVRDEYLLVGGKPRLPALKIGTMNRQGWLGYLIDDLFFCKTFTPQPELPHPDLGCNTEIYCNDRFIELETLGQLVELDPGQAVIHSETWEIYEWPAVPFISAEGRHHIQELQAK
jgi:hypothetical protein